ncbi:unnamed protein product [Ixodes hexagonus]
MSPRKTRSSINKKATGGSMTTAKAPQPNGGHSKTAAKPKAKQSKPLKKEASTSKRQRRTKNGIHVRNGSCAEPTVKLENGLVGDGDSAPSPVDATVMPKPKGGGKGLKRPASPAKDPDAQSPKRKGTAVTKVESKTKSPKKSPAKNQKFVGAHVSASGGLELAVQRAVDIGARSFALFLRSQRQWASKPLTQETAQRFRKACREHGFAPHHILPHGSYLLNCGSPDPEVLEKSRATLVDELKRCEMLGLVYYNFHPGSTCGTITRDECMDRIAESINQAHKETTYVISVIENMSRQGHTIGGDFHELRGIIDRVKNKSRIGVCLDTCHAFAAGYNLSTEEGFQGMMQDFESIVGLSYLKAIHLNDSHGKMGSHLDRHENIGRGKIGLDGFRRIMTDPRLDHIPMILETPETDYAAEISLLNDMCSA